MRKNDLWTELKSNFTLSPEDNPENPVKEKLIKSFALKMMAKLFRRSKKELNKFVENKETPEFKGRYEKIRDHWPTRHRKRVRRCQQQTSKMLRRRSITIARGQVATSKPGRCGPRLRMTCLIKASNQRH